jgi:hypothetical protein
LLNTKRDPPNTVIARNIEKISKSGIRTSVLYVKSEKFTTSIAEIKKLKKVLLSFKSLDENKPKARIMNAKLIDTYKFNIIPFMM